MTLTTDVQADDPIDLTDAEAAASPTRSTRKVSLVRRIFMRPRKVLVKAHRWISFFLLAWVVVVTITGAWLVFGDALNAHVLRPELYDKSDGDIGMQAAMDVVDGEIPEDGYLSWVALPVNGRGVYQIDGAWPKPGAEPDSEGYTEEIYRTWYIDPGSGEINGTTQSDEGATWWMYRGHMYLWQDYGVFGVFDPDTGWCRAGGDGHEPGGAHGVVCDVLPDGMDMIGWFGVLWIVVLLTGFYLWFWPGVRRWATALTIRRGRGSFAFQLSLHKVIGFLFWIPLVVIAFTGIMFAFPNLKPWYENVTPAGRDAELWVPPEDAVSEAPSDGAEPMDADEFLAAFEENFPERTIHTIFSFANPEDETATYQAWVDRGYSVWTREGGAGNTLVVMDQYTGDVLYDGPPGEGNVFEQAWIDWGFPLHTGDFAGTFSRTAWIFVAVASIALGVTGSWMWLIRHRKRKNAKARAAARVAVASDTPA
jgi:uncharacterized iron-regulated membrane protein